MRCLKKIVTKGFREPAQGEQKDGKAKKNELETTIWKKRRGKREKQQWSSGEPYEGGESPLCTSESIEKIHCAIERTYLLTAGRLKIAIVDVSRALKMFTAQLNGLTY